MAGNDQNKIALGEILRAAVDPLVKIVISAYKIQESHDNNVSAISASKFKVESLERCATFLGLEIRDANDDKTYSNKKQIADRIILKIESHFEQQCDECEENYQNHFDADNPPRIHCFFCLQGCHDCDAMTTKLDAVGDPVKPIGLVWLCKGCRTKNDPLAKSPGKGKVRFEEPPAPRADPPKPDDEHEDDGKDKDEHTDPANATVCPLYKKNKCPHGLTGKKTIEGVTCQHLHPRKCIRFCKFGNHKKLGCTKGAECKFFHPVLCRNSLVNRRCVKEECTFTHLKGTKRHPESDDTPEEQTVPKGENPQSRPSRPVPGSSTNTSDVTNTTQNSQAKDASFLEGLIADLKASFDKKFQQIEHRLQNPSYPPITWANHPTMPMQHVFHPQAPMGMTTFARPSLS